MCATSLPPQAASALGAFVVFVEHRYYGLSLPFGARGSFTREGLRYLSIEQVVSRETTPRHLTSGLDH